MTLETACMSYLAPAIRFNHIWIESSCNLWRNYEITTLAINTSAYYLDNVSCGLCTSCHGVFLLIILMFSINWAYILLFCCNPHDGGAQCAWLYGDYVVMKTISSAFVYRGSDFFHFWFLEKHRFSRYSLRTRTGNARCAQFNYQDIRL